jgi:DNA-binding MarR family transcriptional regulator
MIEDVVRSLGYLPLGSRFRRIGERLQADTQRILEELGQPLQASHHPFLAALDRLGPQTIGELAEAVGVTQPGATRSIGQLAELGLVQSRSAPDDQRRRIVSLTKSGEALVEQAKATVWPRVEHAVADLCDRLEGSLLDQLDALEDAIAERPLYRRVPKPEQVKK